MMRRLHSLKLKRRFLGRENVLSHLTILFNHTRTLRYKQQLQYGNFLVNTVLSVYIFGESRMRILNKHLNVSPSDFVKKKSPCHSHGT
jgi:hypothetical protein